MGSEPRESATSRIRERLILWIERLLWRHPEYRSPHRILLSQDWRDVSTPLLFTKEMQRWCHSHLPNRFRYFQLRPESHPIFDRFFINQGMVRDTIYYLYFCHRVDMAMFQLAWSREIAAANALIDKNLLAKSEAGKMCYLRLYLWP